jgi:hypothetical protein
VRNTRWEGALDQFAAFWEGLEDPRTGNAGLHDFHELLMIALCAVLCGGQGTVDMALFAKAKGHSCAASSSWKTACPAAILLSLPKGSRLFRQLDSVQFQAAFQRFMAGFSKQCQGVVAIDGGSSPVIRSRQRQVTLAHGQCLGL